MAIDFPNSPSDNDTYTVGNKTWVYSSSTTTWSLREVGLLGANSVTSTELASNSVTSDKIVNETIVNADVAINAAIATTKITGWEDDQVIMTVQMFA